MIDNESIIGQAVLTALRTEYPDITVYDETLLAPSVFPCVCIEQIDNYVNTRTVDSGSNENHVVVTYEVNVYSNKRKNKKSECKAIFSIVSDTLVNLGFMRNSMLPMSIDNSTKFRIVGRFSANISANGEITRR